MPAQAAESPCFVCDPLHHDPYTKLKNSLADYRQARDKGCAWCFLVCDVLGGGHDPLPEVNESDIENSKTVTVTYDRGIIESDSRVIRNAFRRYDLYQHEDDYTVPWLSLGRSIPEVASVQYVGGLVRLWLADCMDNHKLCHQPSAHSMPKRLLDLGVDGKSCKLIKTTAERLQYVALSYRWGDPKTCITTTKATIDEHESGIDLQSLPRTLADAAQFTAGIGQRYLWIDSLCIMQDDPDDWEQEAAKMGSIYEAAILVFAADAAADAHGGLFPTRSDYQQSAAERVLDFRINTCESKVYVRKFHLHKHTTQFGMGADVPTIQDRAWTFQERLLSTRIVHFTVNELIWECRTTTCCEIGESRFLPPSPSSPSSLPNVISRFRHDDPNGAFVAWVKLVQDYTARKLTYASDKLPAISAIAKKFDKNSDDEYLAGMWRRDLARYLQWEIVCSSGAKQRTGNPSWSWISVDQSVAWPGVSASTLERQTWELEILSAACSAQGSDPMIRISAGTIVARGRTLPGKLKLGKGDLRNCKVSLERRKVGHLDIQDVTLTSEHWLQPDTTELVHLGGQSLLCLVLRSRKEQNRRTDRMDFGMLALKRSERHADAYERVGLISSVKLDVNDAEDLMAGAQVQTLTLV